MERLDRIVSARAGELIDLRKRKARGEYIRTGAPVGHPAFDRRYGGLPLGVVTGLVADTSIGKTAIAAHMAKASASRGRVLWFNLEDGAKNLADRVLGEATDAGASALRIGDFGPNMDDRLLAVKGAPLTNIWVEEEVYEIGKICEGVTRWAKEARDLDEDPLMFILDYVQLAEAEGGNETLSIKHILRSLQKVTKETGTAGLALSQVATKKVMDRGQEHYWKAVASGVTGDERYAGYEPQMGDFHWSSEFPQFAKAALSGFRPGPYREIHGDTEEDSTFWLRVLKYTQGPRGKRYGFPWIPRLGAVGSPR